jgi:iron complex transport system ATP-binding protein
MKKVVEISNLSVVINGKHILKNINWNFYDNENWGIIGKNGSGKSFFLRLLYANIYPTEGTIKIFGNELGKINIWDIKKRIGFASDLFLKQYDQNTTVLSAVYSGYFSSNGLYDNVNDKIIKDTSKILRFLKLYHLRDKYFGEISHGEQKRVLIARALVFNPQILVFDEVCSGLDISSREELLLFMGKLVKKGHNIIYVTHHIEEIIPAINKIMLLKNGEIYKSDNKKKVMKKKILNEVLDYKFDIKLKNNRYWYKY